MKSYLYILLIQMILAGNAYARVYKCQDDTGRTSYQARPCAQAEQESIVDIDPVYTTESEDSDGFIISKSALLGTWTDVYPRSALSSTWTFTSYEMTYRRYSGKVVRARYTLEKDKLVIHHPKSALNNAPWDEVYELKKFEDNVLIVDSITRMRLRKL